MANNRTIKTNSRKRFIFATFLLASVSVVMLTISLATQNWLEGSFSLGTTPGKLDYVSYGLFKGKHDTSYPVMSLPLYMMCLYDLKVCGYSCRPTEALREEELRSYYSGINLRPACTSNLEPNENLPIPDAVWFNMDIYISIIFFLSLSILFATLSALFGIYNTNRNPIQPIFGILGLYIWNGCAAASNFLVLMLWGIHYSVNVTPRFSYLYTMFNTEGTDYQSTPGYSYWLILISMVIHIISPLLLIDRSTETTTTIPIQKADDTIFIY